VTAPNPAPPTCDPEAFAEIYREYLPQVRAYVNFRVKDHHDVLDLVQETFVRLIEQFGDYDPAKGDLGGWLIGHVARGVLRDHRYAYWERREALRVAADECLRAPNGRYRGRCATKENRDRLATALARLSDKQRLAVQIKHLDGMPIHDLAAEMGVPRATALTRLKAGMAALRREFDISAKDMARINAEQRAQRKARAIALHEAGATQDHIAQQVGANRTSVAKWLRGAPRGRTVVAA
jgi:RNA polymerase sigma factor (sigma-70 family)